MGRGEAPATGRRSLRTVPRNFPGRSGTKEDSVYLCSPETATASALTGVITDARDLGMRYPMLPTLEPPAANTEMLQAPLAAAAARRVELPKGPGIAQIPAADALPDALAPPSPL